MSTPTPAPDPIEKALLEARERDASRRLMLAILRFSVACRRLGGTFLGATEALRRVPPEAYYEDSDGSGPEKA